MTAPRPIRLRRLSGWRLADHSTNVVIAALTATGESKVSGVDILSRGYEKFLAKLDALGADFDVIR